MQDALLYKPAFRHSYFSLALAVSVSVCSIGTARLALAQEIRGTPWQGANGIRETVNEIMDRGKRETSDGSKPRENKKGRIQDDRQDDPNAPNVSNWPPSFVTRPVGKTDGGASFGIVAANVDTYALTQTLGTNFLGATYAESLNVPPSPMGAVGSSQILMVLNGRVRTFSKNGVADGALDTTSDSFFDSVRNGAGTTDPRVVYDRLQQRWFVSMINKQAAPNRIMIAVSSGPTITSSLSFTFFYFQHDLVGATPNSDTGQFADFPSLGVDNNALYIGDNVFDPSLTTYLSSSIFVINKANLLSGTLTVTALRVVASTTVSGPFSPVGVTNMDATATTGYFIGANSTTFSVLKLIRVSDPGGTPSFSATASLTVPTTRQPIHVPAQGSTYPLDGIDDRLMNATIVRNIDGTRSLWTSHESQVNSSGTGSVSGGRDGMKFYEITGLETSPFVPTLNQAGTLFDSSATNPRSFWVGSIATSGQGHTILASSYAGAADFAGVAIAGRLASDTLGTLNSTINLFPGAAAYNLEPSPASGYQRWGDYTNAAVDPTDNMTMWAFQEYTNATNSWGVRIIQLKAPPPAALTSISPSTVAAGTNVSVTITGTSSSGSGFYDPGVGFPNHLSAAVSGTGVTVTSVTYTDAPHITLNLTLTSNSAQNGRTVTITNPDGQSVTSTVNFLTVGPPPQITVSPATLPAAVVGTLYSQTISASGGTAPYTFSISAGTMPSGIQLTAATGQVTGTPTKSGTANFTVHAQDSLGNIGSQAYTMTVQSLVTSSVSLSVVSTAYDGAPIPDYVGKFTINTRLINNGPPIDGSSQLFFKLTQLSKLSGDPTKPDKLLTADNGAGVVGDIQTVDLGGVALGTGQFVAVPLLVGLGTRNTFAISLDLYEVLPGSSLSIEAGILKASTTSPPPILLSRFEFKVSETLSTASHHTTLNLPGPFNNLGVITGTGPQSGPAVAVDSNFPNRIAVASNDYSTGKVRLATTEDGGATWQTTMLGPSINGVQFFVAQHPSLAFDSLGRLSVVFSLANLRDSANAIVISESTVNLSTFNSTFLSLNADSSRLVDSRPVILSDSRAGRFVAWDRHSTGTSRYKILVSQSPEGGVFGPPITVVSDILGSSPALALSKSHVYVGWDEWGFQSARPWDNGGRVMLAAAPLRNNIQFDPPEEIARTNIGFGKWIPAMPDVQAGPNLSLAADPNKDDVLYAAFADLGRGLDIRLGRSANRGKSWEFITVNNDEGFADQFSPAMTLDRDGNINISFYDTRLSSTSETAHVFLARSSRRNAFDNQRITTALLNDSKTNPFRDTTANLGDRTAIAVAGDDVLIAWTDTRNGSEDIFATMALDPEGQSITGAGKIMSKAGSYGLNLGLSGEGEFGFDARYTKRSSVPVGITEFKFGVGMAKLRFRSTSYEWLVVSGSVAQLKGSGTLNNTGDYIFVLTVADADGKKLNGISVDKFRIKIAHRGTGALVYDNVPGSPDAINDTVVQPITEGRIDIRDK